jgi:D-hydantoinase
VIDLLLESGIVASVDGAVPACVAIDDGRIAAVGSRESMPTARRTIDVAGRVIMPGAIDGHTHFTEDPGILAEPYETGTRAAAAGGVTTVLMMPWDTPSLEDLDALAYRKAYIEGRAYVDFGLHAGVTAHSFAAAQQNLPRLWDAGVSGVKVLMVSTDPHFPYLDDGQLVEVLQIMAKLDALLIVHAENQAILRHNKARLLAAGRRDPLAHEEYRSALSENEAVRRLTYLAGQIGTRTVIAHMSTARGVQHVAETRAGGAPIYAEVCPRNLWLSTDDLAERGSWVKTGPPVRAPEEVEALWPLVADGSVSVMSSDHAAWTKEARRSGESNIWEAYDGIPQVQEMLPLMLDAVHKGRLSLPDVVRLTSYNPSEIYGLRPRKGMIAPGYDADLVIVEMDREVTIAEPMMQTAVGYTAFDGITVRGWPVMTLVRGEVVMQENEIVGSADHGQFVARLAVPVRN